MPKCLKSGLEKNKKMHIQAWRGHESERQRDGQGRRCLIVYLAAVGSEGNRDGLVDEVAAGCF